MSSRHRKKRMRILGNSAHTGLMPFAGRSDPALNMADGFKALVTSEGNQKMSQVLMDFARPVLVLVDPDDEDAIVQVIQVACIAWNATLVLEQTPELTLRDLLENDFSRDDDALGLEELKQDLEMLIRRKQRRFAQHKRFIQDCQVFFDEEGEIQLLVVSTFEDTT